MVPYPTIDDDLWHGLFEGDDGLEQLVEQGLNQMFDAQVTEPLGAAPSERTEAQKGHRCRTMTPRVGSLERQVPRVRNGEFSTALFRRYPRSEQALVLALMEPVHGG